MANIDRSHHHRQAVALMSCGNRPVSWRRFSTSTRGSWWAGRWARLRARTIGLASSTAASPVRWAVAAIATTTPWWRVGPRVWSVFAAI